MKRKKRHTDGEIDLKLERDENENAKGVKAFEARARYSCLPTANIFDS